MVAADTEIRIADENNRLANCLIMVPTALGIEYYELSETGPVLPNRLSLF